MEKPINENYTEESIKEFLLRKLKSPFFIVGIILVFLFVLISIVPQIFTPYNIIQAFQVQPGEWNPPSPEHPLGQTESGYDVLAVIIYSIPTSLTLALLALIISFGAGILFGYLAGKYSRKIYTIIMTCMIFFYALPVIVIIMLITETYYYFFYSDIIMILILTITTAPIPSITRIIANHVSRKLNLTYLFKTLVCYIPLYFGIIIIIIESIGFLGFFGSSIHTLGYLLNIGGTNIATAPWATLNPGITLFGMTLSFFLLYLGLQDYGQNSETFKFKFRRSEKSLESLDKEVE